jgi:hypothetical protein
MKFMATEWSMRNWWNRGVNEKSLSTNCFFCQMQYSISFESSATNEIADQHSQTFISQRGDKSCFDSIRSKIDHYEYLKNGNQQ